MALFNSAVAYLAGIALGRLAWRFGWIDCATPGWLWLAPVALLSLTPLLNRLRGPGSQEPLRWPLSAGFRAPHAGTPPALCAAVALCLLAGVGRFAAHPLEPCWRASDLAFYNLPADRAYDRAAPEAVVEGFISSYPLVSDSEQRIHLRVSRLETADGVRPVNGLVRLKTGIQTRYAYGQPVRVAGRLVTPPVFEDFSYRDYLARKGIYSLLNDAQIELLPGPRQGNPLLAGLYAVRSRGEALLNRVLPEPYAGLANGMLLGIEAGIPDELYEQFNLTGTSHVIVISGSNVSLLVALIMGASAKLLGRRRAVLPTLLGIGAYALLVGGDAAVLRAALMGGLFVYAGAVGRRSTALVSLALACWVMTLVNPLTLWDVGFQLSSAATAGLILFSDPIQARVTAVVRRFARTPPAPSAALIPTTGLVQQSGQMVRTLLEEGLLVTVAANISTLPLVLFYFGRLSLVSLLTNLLITPVQPLILFWGTLGLVAGLIGLLPLARLLLLAPWLGLVWTVTIVQWTATLPGASLAIGQYGGGSLALTYALIGLLHQRRRLAQLRRRLAGLGLGWRRRLAVGPVTLALAASAALLLWALALTQPDGRLHVHFLDIGQGDGILIATPSGRQVLIDGGSQPQLLFTELGKAMPFWDRAIDLLVLTHPDGDHMNAQIEAPARFAIGHALDTAAGQANPDAAPWRTAVARQTPSVVVAESGGWIDLGDGVALWVLWPPPGGFQAEGMDNENSLVLKLVYGDFSVLLTGDAGLSSEAAWRQAKLPLTATVLKVGHHGSSHSTGKELVAAVDPAIAVIQVGAENTYGHPTAEVLDNLAGRLVLRNDQAGAIRIVSDGKRMWVTAEEGSQYLEGGSR